MKSEEKELKEAAFSLSHPWNKAEFSPANLSGNPALSAGQKFMASILSGQLTLVEFDLMWTSRAIGLHTDVRKSGNVSK